MASKKFVKGLLATVIISGTLLLTAPNAYAALGDQLLSKGMQHTDVATLQQHLKDLGHFTYPNITNYYGSVTEQAVRDFQRSQGLTVDGLFGQASFRSLQNAISGGQSSQNPGGNSNTSFVYTRVLSYGRTGQDVKALQDVMKNLGYLNITNTTTFYGIMTRDAVMSFQRANGLTVDGAFGPSSNAALNGLLGGGAPTPEKPSEPVVDETTGTLTYSRLLKLGVRGDDVQELQNALKKLGHLVISNTTNYYGTMTRDAVMSFQRSQGISVDGMAGSATINNLNRVLSGQASPPDSGNAQRQQLTTRLIQEARKYLSPRVPYAWGGSTPNGFDCSGYTQYVFRQVGISIPRDTIAQSTAGAKISKQNLQPGDLVIFYGTYRPGPSHVGIYLGNNQFIHSRSSGNYGIDIGNLNSSYYSNYFEFGIRVY